MTDFQFTLEQQDQTTAARAGRLCTPHGEVTTPVFMPVGTQATVKTLSPDEVESAGAQIILSNTYHLYLRPGDELLAELGGVHRFMGWRGPVLTDSGGFQVFSMGPNRKIDEQGVTFRSYIDGSTHRFTPERAMAIQENIGADIMMAFDECAPQPSTYAYTRAAMERTHRWLERCVEARRRPDQALFGIVQGGVESDLRRESARFVAAQPVAGIGIGGLSVGEPKEQMYAMTEIVTAELPADKPRYLMGVGSPEDLLEGIARGVDMFDCVLPTRLGRHGTLLASTGRVNIYNAQYARDDKPVEEGCDCYSCSNFSRAYLRHLFRAKEILGLRLATIHNVRFLVRLMEQARAAIFQARFDDFRGTFLESFRIIPHELRAANRAAHRRSLGREQEDGRGNSE